MLLTKFSRSHKHASGFTLIELMIVLTVLSIIAIIALPGYRDYVKRAARSEGKAMLVTAASAEEQFFLNNKTYTTTITGTTGLNMSNMSESGKYQLTVAAGTTANPGCAITTCFTLTATPQGGQTDDTECGNFTLESDGTKGVSGTGGVTECW